MPLAKKSIAPTSSGSSLARLSQGFAEVTEAAAVAAYAWIGRGEKERGDGAAVAAMRHAFASLPCSATVVIGEGEKDDAPMLYNGEALGRGGVAVDIAVDPVDGTNYLAKGMAGAVAVLAAAPAGTLFCPGPAFYMDKFIVPSAARDAVDPSAPVAVRLRELARALDKPIAELRIFVLERPRHEQLVHEIKATGASVRMARDGDVLGGLRAMIGEGVDALMGVGGTPEGVIAACAARALGAGMWGALAPQSETEAARLRDDGMLAGQILSVNDLVASDDLVFACTGITGDEMLAGVRCLDGRAWTETLVIQGRGRLSRIQHQRLMGEGT
ncbi:class II fructose-bisphosphatase [Halomonas sp. M4R5S39]|uniref:class II fructose-bisphosphatase n=1 Tax=Halomonas kalidii TaxID=3043293 RepID=UPI0024A85402|nr:class II fructose-bisphosphatase [Halomonas kalidii]MDI5984214.1 class II fructose-bisphosphatase [Halomonas kalidii]